MGDDHGQAEKEHEEVPEREPGQDAVPRALQVRAVPHGAHQREVGEHPRREQQQREHQERVGPAGAARERVQRVEEPGAALRAAVGWLRSLRAAPVGALGAAGAPSR